MRDDIFILGWRSLTPSARGSWSETDLGGGQAKRYYDSNILVRDDFLKEDELHKLVTLTLMCEGWYGAGANTSVFGRREMDRVIAMDSGFGDLDDVIVLVCKDMYHVGATRTDDLELRRRFLQAVPAEKHSERRMISASQWTLFLNDDYRGGELLFPTRREIVQPRTGRIVRWPKGIPHGIALAHEGYQFTLGGVSL